MSCCCGPKDPAAKARREKEKRDRKINRDIEKGIVLEINL